MPKVYPRWSRRGIVFAPPVFAPPVSAPASFARTLVTSAFMTIPVAPVALEATLDVFNLLNRENVLQVNNVRYLNAQLAPNPQFGAATNVADPRRIQFGLRVSF